MYKYFLLLFTAAVFSQNNGIATYKCSLNADKLKDKISNSKNTSMLKYKGVINSIVDNSEDIFFELKFNNNISHFSVIESLEKNKLNILKIYYARSKYYFDKTKNIKLKQIEAFGSLYLIDISEQKTIWKLTNEKKMINNFLCFKANAEINKNNKVTKLEAWYCPQIPLPFGLMEYTGLPGIIYSLKIINNKYTVNFNLIKLKFSKKPIKIKIFEKGKKVTQKEFEKIGVQIMSNLKNQ